MPYPHLFQEGSIGACRLRNRIIMPLYPTKYSTDSSVNERMLEFYRERAKGGVSMIVLDGFCLDYPSLYKGKNELRADGPAYIEGIQKLLGVIHAEGAKAFMHLNYPKERMFDMQVAGAKQKGDKWVQPVANNMTSEEAYAIIDTMARGASKAKELGYDGVEIQASYGDLISQLLSPLTNCRTDEFGGPPENRARFLIDLIKWTKEAAGNDFPVMVKLVCEEFVPGGITVRDSIETIRMSVKAGADAILANAGNKSTKNMTIPSHYTPAGALVDIAAGIKKSVDIPVIAIGKINTPEFANDVIGEGKADFVAMARALVADPQLPKKAFDGRRGEIRGCIYCLQDCAQSGAPGFGRGCTVNPFAGQEYLSEIRPAEKKKIAIIGGGPAGMQAALIASQRGHEVTLYERKDNLGGQFLFAARAPFKDEVSELLRYLNYMLSGSNVDVLLNTSAGIHEIAALGPDAVIIATGSRSRMPAIPGADLEFVHDVREVYESSVLMPYLHSPGRRIVILGGGDIGCETADMLAGEDRDITIIEILPEALSKTKDIPKEDLLRRLKKRNVKIITETEAVSIGPGKVQVKDKEDNLSSLPADSVIVSIGIVSENFLLQPLKDKIPEVYAIGDAAETGNVGSALRSALKVALSV